MNILLIGHGAREHAIAEALRKNIDARLFSFMKSKNPGIASLSEKIEAGNYSDIKKIKQFAEKTNVDFAFIGPEDPLNEGVVDALEGIVIKPDGLTAGKGVKVQDDHFKTKKEALEYCKEVLKTHPAVVVEEKFEGEEFSLQCFSDGKTAVGMPVVQDHKRAYENDKGPNTGGMGSYSCENHLLPFLKKSDVEKALEITKKVNEAIYEETGSYYKGIMYGGFILTKNGIKLLEYNARFGDPEAMNVLPILKTDFAAICQAIITQELSRVKVEFEKKATVCKYVVPLVYPDALLKNEKIEINTIQNNAKVYYASVEQRNDGIYMTGSRAIAFVGIGKNVEEAEKIAEEAVSQVKGRVFHRRDIGTKVMIQKRINHIRS